MKWLIYTLHYSHIQMIRSPMFKLLYYTVESKILYLNISSTVSKDLEYYMSPVFCFPDQSYLLNGLHACYVSSVVSNTYNPMDCRLPGSSVHGILQAIILEWVAISSSGGSSWHRDQIRDSWFDSWFDQTCDSWFDSFSVSCIAGRCFFKNYKIMKQWNWDVKNYLIQAWDAYCY